MTSATWGKDHECKGSGSSVHTGRTFRPVNRRIPIPQSVLECSRIHTPGHLGLPFFWNTVSLRCKARHLRHHKLWRFNILKCFFNIVLKKTTVLHHSSVFCSAPNIYNNNISPPHWDIKFNPGWNANVSIYPLSQFLWAFRKSVDN